MKKLDILENQVNTVYLGIGSNLGNRVINIEKAKSLLIENHVNLISISSYFETLSWPDPNKPKFLQTKWGFGYIFIPDNEQN